jgi:hypothetical protein
MTPTAICGYPGIVVRFTVVSIAAGYTGDCVSLLNPIPRMISSTRDAITVATMTICGLRSSAKLLWNFYLRVISDPM